MTFGFEVRCTDGRARRGVLTTPHGRVETPVFMPVGTQAAVKALTHRQVEEAGAEIVLANTYHLAIRPGDALIARRGGLHRFTGWTKPLLTDSGGYQVFSLAERRRVREDGVEFRSHLDGSLHTLTPESAVDIQARLGSDITMVLDECLPYPAAYEEARASTDLTTRWARRARDRFLLLRDRPEDFPDVPRATVGQAQFGIVQGGVFADLRRASAEAIVSIGFEGYALGGLSVGEPVELMYEVVETTVPLLPESRPRYLMGVGTPLDLVEAVAHGVDMFDCVLPTRNARNGQLFTRAGRLNIKNAAFAEDDRPPDEACSCYTCRTHSRAYLRHLFMAGEITASVLNSLHNLRFYLDTLRGIREAIEFGRFESFRQAVRRIWSDPLTS
ncbi:MAG TPA: tRNA guanosine(34) transglycosylase Tgt [Vicinamibacterales bacterium]|nr:tRNA guanosine(34) transglycosylase Tgt [Vicinamibacterales bacterium]